MLDMWCTITVCNFVFVSINIPHIYSKSPPSFMTSAKIHWCSLYSHYCAFSLCLASYLLCLIICRHAWNDLCYAYKHILLVICFVNNCRPLVHVSRVVPKLSAVLACLKCSLKSHKCKSFQPIIIILHTYTYVLIILVRCFATLTW